MGSAPSSRKCPLFIPDPCTAGAHTRARTHAPTYTTVYFSLTCCLFFVVCAFFFFCALDPPGTWTFVVLRNSTTKPKARPVTIPLSLGKTGSVLALPLRPCQPARVSQRRLWVGCASSGFIRGVGTVGSPGVGSFRNWHRGIIHHGSSLLIVVWRRPEDRFDACVQARAAVPRVVAARVPETSHEQSGTR